MEAWGSRPGRPGTWEVSALQKPRRELLFFANPARCSFAAPQHGARAADPGALLRRAVPLLLAGLRGDAGRGGRGQREERTQDLWSRAIPGNAQSGLGQADRQPGLKVTLYF